MVEVQHTQIGDAAVDTRVLSEVRHQELLGLGPCPRRAFHDDADVMLTVQRVVPTRRLSIAVTAHLL